MLVGVLGIVVEEVLLLLLVGLVIGVPAAIALGRYVSAQLHGIQPNDPGVGVFTTALLSMVAATAGLIPAQRASRIDPIMALRFE